MEAPPWVCDLMSKCSYFPLPEVGKVKIKIKHGPNRQNPIIKRKPQYNFRLKSVLEMGKYEAIGYKFGMFLNDGLDMLYEYGHLCDPSKCTKMDIGAVECLWESDGKVISMPAREYMIKTLIWAFETLNIPELFPFDGEEKPPKGYLKTYKNIFNRLSRILAHFLYAHHEVEESEIHCSENEEKQQPIICKNYGRNHMGNCLLNMVRDYISLREDAIAHKYYQENKNTFTQALVDEFLERHKTFDIAIK
ncbi:hypothetical protein EIN_480400 [Entamoeba invadens IP1]|uniref:Mob1/phocein family protein n=1 Tax=Entamoeba invadens IP1 TaxID=370355 RepID=L7FN10_ENTIV|nr:hypothetical protein EIN_480400 [Entamoeba invadens IP1]ELP91151.1 hypothetical protein EIN_480400 [Entamoeba invadens IP1]|eukprot:XP_004257922.1 hypothetical protein EIN_480400 [Entamoeba invadens IP1]